MLSVETVRFLGSRWLPVFFFFVFFTSFTCLSLKIHQQILCFVFFFSVIVFLEWKQKTLHTAAVFTEFEFEFKQNVCFKKTSIFSLFWVFCCCCCFPRNTRPTNWPGTDWPDWEERSTHLDPWRWEQQSHTEYALTNTAVHALYVFLLRYTA